MVEFGLIPTQIMNKDCSKREKKEDLIKGKEIIESDAILIKYDWKVAKEQIIFNHNKENLTALIGAEISPEKISLVLHNNLLIEKNNSYSIFDKKFTDELINTTQLIPSTNKMGEYFNDFNKKTI